VGVVEIRSDLDLPHETLGAERCSQVRAQNLDCYLAAMLEVLGEVDRSHATAAQLSLDRVATLQRRG